MKALSSEWAQMDAHELRDLTATLFAKLSEREAQLSERDAELGAHKAQLDSRDEQLKHKQLKIDQLTHEMAILKRWRYARRSEQLDAVQRSLLDESIDADLEAIGLELEGLKGSEAYAVSRRPAKESVITSAAADDQPSPRI